MVDGSNFLAEIRAADGKCESQGAGSFGVCVQPQRTGHCCQPRAPDPAPHVEEIFQALQARSRVKIGMKTLRDGVLTFTQLLFSLRIPHRCSSTHKLFLFHWPEDQIFCDKIPGAEFTDEECVAEVTGFGLYAVINTDLFAPDVVYGKLDVGKRWRDNIGKVRSRVQLSMQKMRKWV